MGGINFVTVRRETNLLSEADFEAIKRRLGAEMVNVLTENEPNAVIFFPIKSERQRKFDDTTEFRFRIDYQEIVQRRDYVLSVQSYMPIETPPTEPKRNVWQRLIYLFTGK